MTLTDAIWFSGVLHFGTLLASFTVPRVLDWRGELDRLSPLSRQLIWVHGAFIVLSIAALGLVALLAPGELASRSLLARAVTGYIAVFWGVRLAIQLFYFDARPYLTSLPLKLGYHGLTLVFLYQTCVMLWASCG